MSVDASAVYSDLAAALNASSTADIAQGDSAEFYAWFNEAAKHLARKVGLFVERDATLTVTAGSDSTTLPARHIATVDVSFDSDGSGAWRPLRPASAHDLEALDASDSATTGTPKRFAQDREGMGDIRVHPIPTSDANLAVISRVVPADVSAVSPTLAAPSAVGDYLRYFALRRARRADTDEGMPEVSDYCNTRLALYEQVFEQYWGKGQ